MAYYLQGEREGYSVTDDGLIGRPGIGLKPSGQWKMLGFVRRNNFGHTVAFVPWEVAKVSLLGRDLRHANGKPKWFVRDLDHGTAREWWEKVYRFTREG